MTTIKGDISVDGGSRRVSVINDNRTPFVFIHLLISWDHFRSRVVILWRKQVFTLSSLPKNLLHWHITEYHISNKLDRCVVHWECKSSALQINLEIAYLYCSCLCILNGKEVQFSFFCIWNYRFSKPFRCDVKTKR